MSKYFYATTRGNQVGDGTVGDLADWLEFFVNLLCPENGIEYWSYAACGRGNVLARSSKVPMSGVEPENVHHPVCYVRSGNCEGRIIEVYLNLRNGTFKKLCWLKSFGGEDESWKIARYIDAALSSIIFYDEIPTIVEFGKKLPRAQSWHRETSLKGEVKVVATPYSLQVTTAAGDVLYNQNWVAEGYNAKFAVEAALNDWLIVLTNMKAQFTVANEEANMSYYRLMLLEFPDDESLDKTPILFDCWGENREHADEQARNAYPDCNVLGLEGEVAHA